MGTYRNFYRGFSAFWLSLVLKEIMVPGRSFNLSASKCLYRSVVDPGEGPRGPTPLTFGPICGPKGWEKVFLDRPTPLISGSGWPSPPLSEGLDPPMQVHYNDQVTFLSPLLPRSPRASVVSTSPVHHFPQGLTPQTDSVWEWCPFLVQFQLDSSWILVKTYCRKKIVELVAFRVGVRELCLSTVLSEH